MDVKAPVEMTAPSPVQAAEVFLKEIGQKSLADQCVDLNGQLVATLGKRQDLLHKGAEHLKQYSRIQQLYPRSAVKNHRIVFWSDAIENLEVKTTGAIAQEIKDSHEQLVQSEDSSLNGARKRLIKAKNGCLASQVDEPREGLKAKLTELRRRKCQEDMVFKGKRYRLILKVVLNSFELKLIYGLCAL